MKKMTLFTVALCLSFITTAQMLITGIVTNDSIPLESASVIIKNSTTGIATNTKGEFKLEAKKGDTLSVSYLGYKTKEVVLNESENFKFKLEEDNYLDEVVVVGYSPREFGTYGCRPYYITDETNLDHNNIEQNKSISKPIFKRNISIKVD